MQGIIWPVTVIDLDDPGFNLVADNEVDLIRYVEFWNVPMSAGADDGLVLTDALGRQLGGKIDMIDGTELYVLPESEQAQDGDG
jgi:hypothetical protein